MSPFTILIGDVCKWLIYLDLQSLISHIVALVISNIDLMVAEILGLCLV